MLVKVGELESAAGFWVKLPKNKKVKPTFKVGHECLGSAVESVDDHLAVRRTSDLDTSVLQAWCRGCAVP